MRLTFGGLGGRLGEVESGDEVEHVSVCWWRPDEGEGRAENEINAALRRRCGIVEERVSMLGRNK